MKKKFIVCFSGTGNSFYIANQIAEKLGNFEVKMISHLLSNPDSLEEFDELGIVFPTYCFVPPEMVTRFITDVLSKYDLKKLENLFVITSVGSKPVFSLRITEYLLNKIGCSSSYSNMVKSISTYIPFDPIPQKKHYFEHMEEMDKQIDSIVEDLKANKIKIPKNAPFYRLFFGIAKKTFYKIDPRKIFVVNESCTGCGKCVSRCPGHCLELKDNKAYYIKNNCQGCWGCYHFCPEHAIAPKKSPKGGILTWYQNSALKFNPDYSEKNEVH